MTLFLQKIIEHWIFIRFQWLRCQNLLMMMNFKKKNKKKTFLAKKPPKNPKIEISIIFTPPYLFFWSFLYAQFLDLDFMNILVPTFWKSDENFGCYDFLLFSFWDILRSSTSSNMIHHYNAIQMVHIKQNL